jgi:hypothetical protein
MDHKTIDACIEAVEAAGGYRALEVLKAMRSRPAQPSTASVRIRFLAAIDTAIERHDMESLTRLTMAFSDFNRSL